MSLSFLDHSTYPQFLADLNIHLYGPPAEKLQEILFKSLEECKNSIKSACNKRIKPNEISFECYDCAYDFECHIICAACFTKVSHKGHKFRYNANKAGLCDCGNLQALKPHSHCDDHRIMDFNGPNLIKEYIPEKLAKSFIENFQSILYDFLMNCEKSERNNSSNSNTNVFLKKKGYLFIIKYIKSLLEVNSPAIDYLIIELLMNKFDEKYLFSHNCNNFLLLQFDEKNHICECNVLELLFRLNLALPEKFAKKYIEIFEKLSKYTEFKRNLAMVYSKMWNFIVYIPKYPNIFTLKLSFFLGIYSFFFTKELSEIWLKSHHFLMRLIEKTGDIIDCFFTSLNVHAYNAFDMIKSMFFFILKRDSLEISLWEPKILESFILVINKTHNPKTLIEEDNEKCRLHIECILLMIYKNFLCILLKSLDFKSKSLIFEGILKKIIELLKEIYSKNSDNNTANSKELMQNKWPLHNTLQRSLSLIILVFLLSDENFTKKNWISDFSLYFQDNLAKIVEKPIDFMSKTVKILLISIKFSQEKVKPVTFYEMFENPFEGMKREVINGFYKKSYYLQNDYDIVLLQLFAILTPDPKDFLKAFTQGFDIDLPQIFFKSNDETYKKGLKDLLNNLVYLTNDHISMLNASAFMPFSPTNPMKSLFQDTLNFLIINTFQNPRINDMKTAKSLLFDKVLSYDISLEDAIKQATFPLAGNTKTLRIKPEYEGLYDPYIFYKYPKLANECYEGIKKQTLKNVKNDVILGNYKKIVNSSISPMFYVKKSVFSTELPRYLVLIFKIEAFSKEYSEILKSTIKLMYIFLLSIEEGLKLDTNIDPLISSFKQYYQNNEFLMKLEALKGQKSLLEAKASFDKILELLKSINEMLLQHKKPEISIKPEEKHLDESFSISEKPMNISEKSPTPFEKPIDNSKSDIQRKPLQKKQDKLKKEYMEKQKLFLQKNLTSFEDIKSMNKEDEILTCFYCYEPSDGQSSYDVYLSSDNLSCFSYGKLKSIFGGKGENSWFSLSSCLHHVHKQCNEKMLKNNLKALVQKKILYTSILESLCGHCKSLNNLFVFFNDEKVLYEKYTVLKTNHQTIELSYMKIIDILKQIIIAESDLGTVKGEYIEVFKRDSQEFFDLLLRVFLNNEENEIRLNTSETTFLIENLNILLNAASNVSLNGLTHFIKRNRLVYRNFYIMFREYFFRFQSKEKPELLKSMKNEAFEIIHILYEENITPDIQEIDRKSQKLLWILALFFKNEENTLFLMITSLCKQIFLIFLAFYTFSTFFAFKTEQDIHIEDKTDILSFMQCEINKNSEYRSFLATNMSQIARKLIGILTIIFRFEENELKGISPESFLTDEEELAFYAQRIDGNIFLMIFSKEELKNRFYIQIIEKLMELKKKHDLTSKDFLEYYPLNYHILPLPKNFFELQQEYGLKKCQNCQNFSLYGHPYLCLLCSAVLCSVDCKHEKKAEKGLGNLNYHAKNAHSGKCGYMNLATSLVVLMNYPRSITFGHLYKDEYGENLNERNLKWEKFELDTKMYTRIQDMMIGKRVPQEICYKLMENEEVVVDIDYL